MQRSAETLEALPASFRDPSGFLFRREGVLYRQVNPSYQPEYRHLLSSGLYRALVEQGLLIPHEEADASALGLSPPVQVLRPEIIPFISYPYEWCFSQLKEAALLTLKIQRTALQFGMALKDASATNVQFLKGRPIWIDTLSFERADAGQPWVAYRQFCQHFLSPLALAAFRDPRLPQLSRIFLDGIPLDLASSLLPWRTRWSLSLSVHLHLHARAQKHLSGFPMRPGALRASPKGLEGLLHHLEATVRSLRWDPPRTAWSDYYETSAYPAESLEIKGRILEAFLSEIRPAPRIAWDLGANTGRFSRIPAGRGILTLAFDADPACVELNCRQARQSGEEHLLPLLMDLGNPSPAMGWGHEERWSLTQRGPADLVMALALVHHLRIGHNVPFARAADWLHRLCGWLVIEYVPKIDPQVGRLLTARKDVFSDYTQEAFESAFARRFRFEKRAPIPATGRELYLMRSRNATEG